MTASLQILETVQSLVVETEDGALTLLIEGQGLSLIHISEPTRPY